MDFFKYLKIFFRFFADGWLKNKEIKVCEKELLLSLTSEENGHKEDAAELIEGILEFKDTEVREILVPIPQMVMLDVESGFEKVVEIVTKSGFSRYPVYEDEPGNVVGVTMVKDLIGLYQNSGKTCVSEIMRPPFFVPESKKISELLKDFKAKKQRMAIVIDEFGEVSGLVTQTDILEEILGELADEKSAGQLRLTADKDGWHIVPGTFPFDDIREHLEQQVDEVPKIETFAGYLIFKLGRIPEKGERFTVDEKIEAVIIEADERRIKTVKFRTV